MIARLIVLAMLLLVAPAHAQYSGGSGTAENPYQIATAEDLTLLGETSEDYAALAGNIETDRTEADMRKEDVILKAAYQSMYTSPSANHRLA